MSEVRIITNNQPRLLLYWDQLSEKEKSEFDWITESDCDNDPYEYNFFRYKDWVYCLSEFMRVDNIPEFAGWSGYHSDSFFSGILVRLCEDSDYIVCGWYCS